SSRPARRLKTRIFASRVITIENPGPTLGACRPGSPASGGTIRDVCRTRGYWIIRSIYYWRTRVFQRPRVSDQARQPAPRPEDVEGRPRAGRASGDDLPKHGYLDQ